MKGVKGIYRACTESILAPNQEVNDVVKYRQRIHIINVIMSYRQGS